MPDIGDMPDFPDRYQPERPLGAGGMAQVYLVRDLRHDRLVALKVLRPELGAILGGQRFLAEIRTTAQLVHAHILPLLDSGETGGLLWYTMPYVDGETLRTRLMRETQLPIGEAVRLAREVALALDAAHRRGIIHRDIKPENILLQDGTALVADFGIALALREAGGTRLTESGLSLGTPQYMSPEQASGGRQMDARSDVYSLGAVLYEMLAGEAPHTGPTVQSIIAKLMTEHPVAIRTVRSTVSPALAEVVHRCLAKAPADRFANAGELAQALADPAMITVTTVPSVPTVPLRRAAGRRLVKAGIIIGAVLALGVTTIALWSRSDSPVEPAIPRANQITPIQLTVEGNASHPVLSADGERVAYTVRRCDSTGLCREEIEIRDLNGAGQVRLPGSYTYTISIEYSNNGRWLLVQAYERDTIGMFLVPVLGGQPRRLPEWFVSFLGAGDTLIGPRVVERGREDGPPVAYLRTAVDGVVRDSIVFPGIKGPALFVGSPSGRLVNVVTLATLYQSYITDRRGKVLDTLPEASVVEARGRWSKTGDALYLPRRDSTDPRLMSWWRLPVDPVTGRVGQRMEPVLLNQASQGRFDIAETNGNMVFDRGQDRNLAIRLTRTGTGFRFRELRNQTVPFFMALSPDGRSAAIGTRAPDSSAMVSVMDLATGTMRPLVRLTQAPGWSGIISMETGEWDSQDRLWLPQPAGDSTSDVLRISLATGNVDTVARVPMGQMNIVTMPGGDFIAFGWPGNRMYRGREGRPEGRPELFTIPDSLSFVYLVRPLNDSSLLLGVGGFKFGVYRLDWPSRTLTHLTELGNAFVNGGALDGRMMNVAFNPGTGLIGLARLDPWTGKSTRLGEFSDQGITDGWVLFDGRKQPAVLLGARYQADIVLLRGAVSGNQR